MLTNLNYQKLFSYFGIIPYIIIILDRFFLHQFTSNILLDFSILYSLIIFVFIGAMNWNLKKKLDKTLILLGIMPSLCSVLVILLYLNNYSVISLIIILLSFQLFFDYKFIYKEKKLKNIFFGTRMPLTLAIVLVLFIIQ